MTQRTHPKRAATPAGAERRAQSEPTIACLKKETIVMRTIPSFLAFLGISVMWVFFFSVSSRDLPSSVSSSPGIRSLQSPEKKKSIKIPIRADDGIHPASWSRNASVKALDACQCLQEAPDCSSITALPIIILISAAFMVPKASAGGSVGHRGQEKRTRCKKIQGSSSNISDRA